LGPELSSCAPSQVKRESAECPRGPGRGDLCNKVSRQCESEGGQPAGSPQLCGCRLPKPDKAPPLRCSSPVSSAKGPRRAWNPGNRRRSSRLAGGSPALSVRWTLGNNQPNYGAARMMARCRGRSTAYA
jgi:hypothetical protein